MWSLEAWLLVAALGVLRVDLNGRVLGVLLTAEVAVLLVLSVAGLGDPASGLPLTSLSPGGLFGHPGLGALLVTALLGYVGFEAAAVFSEEARLPRRTVPVATYASLAIIGAAYALASWAMSVHYGDDQVAAVAAEQGPGMLFSMASPAVAEIATVLFMTSQHRAAHRRPPGRLADPVRGRAGRHRHLRPGRLGPDGAAVLLGRHHPRVRGAVPAGGHLPGRAAVLRPRPAGRERLAPPVAPALAALALLAMVWTGLANYATLLGVPPGATEAWALPAAFGVAAVAGVAYGVWLRAARPSVYQGVGLGADGP